MTSSVTAMRYLPSLNGARALVALLMFLIHLSDFPSFMGVLGGAGTQLQVSTITTRLGGAVVVFFFVLSGFIMTWVAPSRDTAARFWRRRFFRIYPSYLVAGLIGLVALLLQDRLTAEASIPSALVIQTYNYMEWMPGLNMPTWSVVCDVLFYLCFPVMLWVATRISPSRLWLWAGALVVAMVAVPLLVDTLVSAEPAVPYDPGISFTQLWLAMTFAPVTLLEFALGVILARIVQTGKWARVPVAWAACALVVPAVLVFFVPTIYCLVALWIIPMFLVIGSLATSDLDGRATWLNGRVMVWLGNLTLVFYLVHYPVLEIGRLVVGPGSQWPIVPGIAVSLLTLAVVVGLAWLIRVTVEKPAYQKWARPGREQHVPPMPVDASR